MIPVIVILAYLALIAFIGGMAFKKSKENTEDFFLANRSIGPLIFFLSIFATNMTAFAILGSSGQAYRQGIGIYGLMASSSCFVIPLTIFFIGTRLWALGKKFGHQTQVSYFRDRWECNHIGTVIFALTAAMLVPYMIISIMGGGTVLANISASGPLHQPLIPYAWGCAVVAVVVTLNVFLGGMRGTVWVNILQTILFLCFGAVAVAVISHALPLGFSDYMSKLAADPKTRFLVTRERMPQVAFWSYTLIPLSSIMFPHMAIMCFSARHVSAFKQTVIAYPLAILAIWLPCVFLGVLGFATLGKIPDPDGVLVQMLQKYAPAWLAGVLGAGIISAVMGSDAHQVLALSTMFTKDIIVHYGGREKFGERRSVHFARIFIIFVTLIAYFVALSLKEKQGIFEIAVRYAFSGFAAMAPVMVAALFWKRSTKWGALAATLLVGGFLVWTALMQAGHEPGEVLWQIGEIKVFFMNPRGDVSFWNGFMTVVPMVIGSSVCVVLFSLLTRPPSPATIARYFDATASHASS
ncbi:MAG TPA: sodium:solute symporter family protein [Candidatus Baltobacteraceae bacterium]|jgi:SSS family solute:Na+ symporter|nr:sodium:solute symporter family protein [Candidatus Baltobacteraceae bacterium]